ncbi:MAG: manganese efflux pump [Clostridia bacterium]|nr:manganese efflux pump [Clostridia bacterium]
MGIFEILMLAIALSMDAAAVGMTDGMTDKKMPLKKILLIGLFFGAFQALMPLLGYFISALVANAFLSVFEKISGFVSFALLAFLGGKMLFDVIKERKQRHEEERELQVCTETECTPVSKTVKKNFLAGLFLQAVATSIDALAVGVTLNMSALSGDLPLGIWWSVAIIGVTTFILSVAAVYIGKKLGDKLADKAEICGGVVLIGIGLKILIESLL